MNLNSVYVADIETDGLNATKIHVLSVDNPTLHTFDYGKMRKFCKVKKPVVMHNGMRFDKPVLERLLNTKVEFYVIDTLFLSWYIYPARQSHGLESYGEEFGVPKPKVDDWENLSPEEYAHRCNEDVKINRMLWNKMLKDLRILYGTDEEVWRLIDYLMFKAKCAADQEVLGWKLDKKKCEEGLRKLQEDEQERLSTLARVMPKAKVWGTMQRPKNMYLKSAVGVLSQAGERWHERCKEAGVNPEVEDKVKYVSKEEDPNPGSIPQIKDWLYSLGWVPDEFKYVRDKETNEVRKIEQINTQVPGESGLSNSAKMLYEKCPSLEALDGLFVIRHRQGVLQGFLADCDEHGYIRAQISGLTNTLRFKHKVVLNLPGVGKPYGELIRGCLICEDDELICGSDMSGLEDRTGNHYMSQFDPGYVEEKSQKGFDPHLKMAVTAGLMIEADSDFYKKMKKDPHAELDEKFKRLGGIRHVGKQSNYACQYGAMPPRISLTAGIPLHTAKKLHEAYWKINWSIKAVADAQKVKKIGNQMWLFNPVSKLWYSLRSDKDRFSTLNQGTGVYCFDTWLRYVKASGMPIIAQIHDELAARIKSKNKEKCEKVLREAMSKTNEELKLSVKLDCDIKFGQNYAEVH